MELGVKLDWKFHAIVYFAGKPGEGAWSTEAQPQLRAEREEMHACYPANSPRLGHQDWTPGNRVAYSARDLPTSGKELRQFLIDMPTEQLT